MKIEWKDSEVVKGISRADIGNYIRFDLAQRKDGSRYVLYLHIRKWKSDGCKEDKLCQAQEVAAFKTGDINLAKAEAERWFKEFVKDMIGFANFSLTELL